MATLLLVGHGSRDPRSAEELRRLAARVSEVVDARDVTHLGGPSRTLPPGGRARFDVRLAFLELSEPLVEDVLAQLTGEVIVVPLLLGAAFHARFDLPSRLAEVSRSRPDLVLTQTDVLGADASLDTAVAARVQSLADQGGDAVVLLGTGSSQHRANAAVSAVAARVEARVGVPVQAAFVTAEPGVEAAVQALRSGGAARVALVPWFLAPGRLLDVGLRRAGAVGVDLAADTLAVDALVADLVVARATSAGAVARAA